MDFQEMFFSFDGRLNRKPYILRFLLRNAIIWCLGYLIGCLLYTSPSPRDVEESRMPSSA